MNTEKHQEYYQINPDVVLREEDPDGALLFNPDSNDVKVLNHSGLHIWKICREKMPREAIITGLKEQYDQVPDDQVGTEVDSFLESLEASGFLIKSE